MNKFINEQFNKLINEHIRKQISKYIDQLIDNWINENHAIIKNNLLTNRVINKLVSADKNMKYRVTRIEGGHYIRCVLVCVRREGCVRAVISLMDRTYPEEDVRYSMETKHVVKESGKREGKENEERGRWRIF